MRYHQDRASDGFVLTALRPYYHPTMINIDPPSSDLSESLDFSKLALTRFLNRVRKEIELPGEVEVLLTSDSTVKRLNGMYRGKNKPTDVLSFPPSPEVGGTYSGDLAISLETAGRQARRFGHTLTDEIKILLLHGLLHLAGEDHETDSGEMAEREMNLRHRFGLPSSLIQRATQ